MNYSSSWYINWTDSIEASDQNHQISPSVLKFISTVSNFYTDEKQKRGKNKLHYPKFIVDKLIILAILIHSSKFIWKSLTLIITSKNQRS